MLTIWTSFSFKLKCNNNISWIFIESVIIIFAGNLLVDYWESLSRNFCLKVIGKGVSEAKK